MSGDHNMYASGSGDGQRTGWRKRTIQEMAREAEAYIAATEDFVGWSFTNEQLEAFAALVRADEREEIAQMIEDAPPLVEFVINDHGGCLICGFTPKLAAASILAR